MNPTLVRLLPPTSDIQTPRTLPANRGDAAEEARKAPAVFEMSYVGSIK